jgi:hypothetical protein
MEYKYKDGSVIRNNDIVFYSEDTGDGKFHYADNISIVVDRDSDLKMKAYVITMDEAEYFLDYEEPEEDMVSLKYAQDFNKDGTCPDITKIGEYPRDAHMLTKEYANENYSIKTK